MMVEHQFRELSLFDSLMVGAGIFWRKRKDVLFYSYEGGKSTAGIRIIALGSYRGKPCFFSLHTSGLFEELDTLPFRTRKPNPKSKTVFRAGVRTFDNQEDAERTFSDSIRLKHRLLVT